MTFRPFSCTSCGHKMRFAGADCGRCHAPKTPIQRKSTYVIVIVLIVLIGAYVLLLETMGALPD